MRGIIFAARTLQAHSAQLLQLVRVQLNGSLPHLPQEDLYDIRDRPLNAGDTCANTMLAALILAGGESRRMGTAKALLPYHSQTFVEHLVEVTNHPRIGAQRIVVGAHAAQIRAQVALDPKIIVENSDWQSGQLSSIHAGIRSLEGIETEGVMLCLVDHPLISSGVVDSLVRAFDRSRMPIVLPTFQSKRGHPLIFASKLYGELLAAPLDKGARVVVWNHPTEICEVPTDEEGVVMNLNDPDSYRYAVQSQP